MKHDRKANSASFRAKHRLGKGYLLPIMKRLRATFGVFSLLTTRGREETVETLQVPPHPRG